MTGYRDARFNLNLSKELKNHIEAHEAVSKGFKIFNTYFSKEDLNFLHFMLLKSGPDGFAPGVVISRSQHCFYDKLLASGMAHDIDGDKIELKGKFRIIQDYFKEHGSLDYNLYTGPIA